jgi:hypothetical protein
MRSALVPGPLQQGGFGKPEHPDTQIEPGLKSSISGPFCDSWQPLQTAAFGLSATSPRDL